MRRRLTATLAADLVGYSRLMGADEAGTLAKLESLRTNLIETKIAELARVERSGKERAGDNRRYL